MNIPSIIVHKNNNNKYLALSFEVKLVILLTTMTVSMSSFLSVVEIDNIYATNSSSFGSNSNNTTNELFDTGSLISHGEEVGGVMYVGVQVALLGDNTVSVINTTTNTIVASNIPIDGPPSGIAFDPVHKRMYVTSASGHSVSVIDTTTNDLADIIFVKNRPTGIAFDPVHNKMYVTEGDGLSVSVINTTTNFVVDSIFLEGRSIGIAFDPVHDRMYVTEPEGLSVSVIDTTTNDLEDIISVEHRPTGIAFDPVHNKMYIILDAPLRNDTVSVIDTNTNEVIDSILVNGSPDGIAFDPVHNRMYVTNAGNIGELIAIDTTSNEVMSFDIPTSEIQGIAFDPVHKMMYIVQSERGFVSVIDTATNTIFDTIEVPPNGSQFEGPDEIAFAISQ